ncbi:2,4'-dihydroxyacetophenone dioxygenase family protein [Rummeliibacillus sp. NPDC094406]|uniref:2,4'-dihydroxyacetophenone dioxygenase family protein n=1 Tax=Rummeliibacillus sp. NPDC094406 TaxID=3364511 RepID=UPI00381E186B
MSNVKAVEVYDAGNICPDDLPWVPYFGVAHFKLLKVNTVTGQTITLLKVPAGTQLPTHFHPGTVIVYTISGSWRYIENDWVSNAGDVVYEPAGSQHTPESLGDEEVITLNIVEATLDYVNENGEIIARDNWQSLLQKYHDHCAAEGITPIDVTQF